MANAKMIDANTAIVTYPVDVWFGGSRTFVASLDFGRPIQKIGCIVSEPVLAALHHHYARMA